MKFILPIVLVVVTALLMTMAVLGAGGSHGTVGIAAGSAVRGLTPKASTPDQALTNLLVDLQRRNWDRAFSELANAPASDQLTFVQDWLGSHGSLRSLSNLEGFESRPLHATNDEAQLRTRLHWTTPVGPIEDVRDFNVVRSGDIWKVVWPKIESINTPAQVIPVTYLRWDLVTSGANDEWGAKNIDAPHVRITSMNAVDSAEGVVVMGEVVNEDTVPAFVNVNATILDASNNPIDDETSFDKIAHVLLPKQVSPYRIDFPKLNLRDVKNVRMDVRPALVPATADPVIGVMNQKVEADAQGKSVLHGELLNESGQTVNIAHVIASFYDNNGKVIWVSDGYIDRALLPQTSEPFSLEIPRSLAGKVQSFHVVVNHYNVGSS